MTEPEPTARAHELSAEAEHLYGLTIRRKESMLAAREQAIKVTGEAASPDGSIQATVDVGGMLTRLVLSPRALRREPDELARLITAVTQRAAASARASVREIFAPLQKEGMVRDTPVLLPEPATPAEPGRRADYDEEASYEDAPSVFRSRGR